MAKVLVFHYSKEGRLPKLSQEELKEIRRKFDKVLEKYPGVSFSTWVDENGMGICDWEAPDAETVKNIVKEALGSPPTDPTVVVKKVL